MCQAIIGLLGVLVGAFITGGANYLLDVRKERAEAAKNRVSRANELKTAARLIANDFLLALTNATNLVERKRWARNFPLDAWQKNREVLARELRFKDWNAVYLAELTVEQLRSLTPDLKYRAPSAEPVRREAEGPGPRRAAAAVHGRRRIHPAGTLPTG
jgi:hypothetical protein